MDVLVRGGKIAAIDPPPQTAARESIDASGLYLLPGVIDDQVHFREPGLTHKEDLLHATRACAAGGVTTFLEMPNTIPNTITVERLREKQALAAGKCLVNFGFYMGATPRNLSELMAATGEATPGIKIFIGSSTGDLLVDDQDALEQIFSQTQLPICAHCEDETTIRKNTAAVGKPQGVADHSQIRDELAAVIAVRRAVDLARRHRHRFHVLHVSTAAEIQEFLQPSPYITAEACLHHLLFNVNDYARLGTLIQMNPSLKTAADNAALWQALADLQLQVVATDHAPHTLEEKQAAYPASPSGLPAVENSLALMLNEVNRGRCSLNQVVHWMCDAPARVWGIVGKGRIEVGYDADLVLVDMEQRKTVRNAEQYTKSGWSPWDGVELCGWPVSTWVGGNQVFHRGKFTDSVRGRLAKFDHARGGYWATPDGIGTP
jgi:dihydroorotase